MEPSDIKQRSPSHPRGIYLLPHQGLLPILKCAEWDEVLPSGNDCSGKYGACGGVSESLMFLEKHGMVS